MALSTELCNSKLNDKHFLNLEPFETIQNVRCEHLHTRNDRATQSLIANWQVATETLLSPSIAATRNEADFAAHITQTVETDAQAGWIFIVDPLNTHQSETLERVIN
jgi:hypothetical protein